MAELTERERQLIVKALAYASEAMNDLDRKFGEPADHYEMKQLLKTLVRNEVELRLLVEAGKRRFSSGRMFRNFLLDTDQHPILPRCRSRSLTRTAQGAVALHP
jgi:hypothetical protein